MALADKSERALQRMLAWTRGFPNPGPKQAVKAAPFLAVLQKLEPLAAKVAALIPGTPKGSYSGVGYFGGSKTVEQPDITNAESLLQRIRVEIPAFGQGIIGPVLLQSIKRESQALLMVATDMEVDETLGDKLNVFASAWLDGISLVWEKAVDIIVDLPEAVYEALKAGLTFSPAAYAMGRKPGDSIMPYVAAGLGVAALVAVAVILKR
jgi:predicted transcriptional regulator